MTKVCPECGGRLRQLKAPRDSEYQCVNGRHETALGFNPIYGTCPVCAQLHESGLQDEWWECYLSDKGLEWLLMYYGIQSDGKSYAICRLVDELRMYRAMLREPV